MTFVFEDGEHVEIEGQQTHSFMSHDLVWAEQAHGRLVTVQYGRSAKQKQSVVQAVAQAVAVPLSKCKELFSRNSRALQQENGAAHARCCA